MNGLKAQMFHRCKENMLRTYGINNLMFGRFFLQKILGFGISVGIHLAFIINAQTRKSTLEAVEIADFMTQ